ncbi:MAG: hypothetical protein ACP5UM_09965, partial [Anaerolineae bacterium]
DAAILALGTVGTLLYFYFTAAREGRGLAGGIQRLWGTVGRWTLLVAFGALFAGALISRLSLFIARVQFLWDQIWSLIP